MGVVRLPEGSGDSHVTLPGNTFWHALRTCPRRSTMSYRIAAIDVHKKMLAVVVTDVEGEGEYQFERRKFGTIPGELLVLAQWLVQQEVEEVVMESTAQYWRPVWGTLEQYWKPARQQREGAHQMSGTLHLCQAKSNHGPRVNSLAFPRH